MSAASSRASSSAAASTWETGAWPLPPPRRYWPRSDTRRPHNSLGLLWAALALSAVALGTAAIGILYGLTAGLGAAQAARAWTRAGVVIDPVPTAIIAAGISIALIPFQAGAGIAILAGTAASVVLARRAGSPVAGTAGAMVRCWLPVGLAGASVVAVSRIDQGAVLVLVILACAYESGDYTFGAGNRWPAVGPIMGACSVAVFSFPVFALGLSPFGGAPVFAFAAVIAVGAPIGQFLGGALLPDSRVLAAGVRRLDTLLVAGPAWVVLLHVWPFT